VKYTCANAASSTSLKHSRLPKADPPLVKLFRTFEGGPEALYIAVEYAMEENVPVAIVPSKNV
jgi:hypothetical protein